MLSGLITLKTKQGFTLIEILIAFTILIILFLITFSSWRTQLDKARDAQKKDDLEKISLAFEEYYSDHGCYPDASIDLNCSSSDLQPYLESVPCDSTTQTAYCYLPTAGSCPRSYRLLTNLKFQADPVIAQLGCNEDDYCGFEADCANLINNIFGFNYGVSSKDITLVSP